MCVPIPSCHSGQSWFFPPTTWTLGIKLRLSGLVGIRCLYLLSDLVSPHTCLICSIGFFLIYELLKKREKYAYIHILSYTLTVYVYSPEEGTVSPGSGVTDSYELACRY